MAFRTFTKNVEEVLELIKTYAQTNLEYFKLKAIRRIAKISKSLFRIVVCLICIPFCLFFLSIAAALFIGECMDSTILGFVIVGGFYLILTLIILLIGTGMVKRTVVRKLAKKMFKNKK